MKTFITCALALVLGTSVAFGISGCKPAAKPAAAPAADAPKMDGEKAPAADAKPADAPAADAKPADAPKKDDAK